MTRLLFITILICSITSLGCTQPTQGSKPLYDLNQRPTNYAECVAAGYPALRSYPGKCIANGQTFIDDSVSKPILRDRSELKDGDQVSQQAAICVDRCGDGICQELVCLGSGCPCAETKDSCPEDC